MTTRQPTSIVWRISIIAVLVAIAAIGVLATLAYRTTREVALATIQRAVATDLAGLVDIHASGGPEELARRLGDRLAISEPPGRRAAYRLTVDDRMYGNLPPLPKLSSGTSASDWIDVGGVRLYAQGAELAPKVDIVVAREFTSEQQALDNLLGVFLAAGALIVLVIGVSAFALARRLASRVERVNAAYRRGDAAAIDALVTAPERDELGELTRRSGIALGRLATAIDEQRHVSDQIAHEIRTPLTHLDGRLRQMRTAEAASRDRLVDAARDDIRGIASMLDSLLDIAANEAVVGSERGFATIDLSALVQNLAELYRPSMEDVGLRFEVLIAPGVTLRGDPMELQRLISNLLDNAIRYVPAGQTVRLHVAHQPLIVVEDTGGGIPGDLRARLFERFGKGPQGGHGLGLALARAIALRHGLSIVLEDGEGCRFVVARGD